MARHSMQRAPPKLGCPAAPSGLCVGSGELGEGWTAWGGGAGGGGAWRLLLGLARGRAAAQLTRSHACTPVTRARSARPAGDGAWWSRLRFPILHQRQHGKPAPTTVWRWPPPQVSTVLVLSNSCGIPMEKTPMEAERDKWWQAEVAAQPSTCEVEWVEAEHPLFLLYTSGSTGALHSWHLFGRTWRAWIAAPCIEGRRQALEGVLHPGLTVSCVLNVWLCLRARLQASPRACFTRRVATWCTRPPPPSTCSRSSRATCFGAPPTAGGSRDTGEHDLDTHTCFAPE